MDQPPRGTVSVAEVLAYLEADRYFDKQSAGVYLDSSPSWLEKHLDEIPHHRVFGRVLFRKSELDAWMALHREGSIDLDEVADRAVREVMGSAK